MGVAHDDLRNRRNRLSFSLNYEMTLGGTHAHTLHRMASGRGKGIPIHTYATHYRSQDQHSEGALQSFLLIFQSDFVQW